MREVIACLSRMKGNSEVQKECAHFVEMKEEWGCKIKEQLEELDVQLLSKNQDELLLFRT